MLIPIWEYVKSAADDGGPNANEERRPAMKRRDKKGNVTTARLCPAAECARSVGWPTRGRSISRSVDQFAVVLITPHRSEHTHDFNGQAFVQTLL
jgi:hypothetical protein